MNVLGRKWELHRPFLLAGLVLVVSLIAGAFAYAPGVSGSLHFDDEHNLDGLAEITDEASVSRFVANGPAGLFGRPIAYASFVPQAYAWPDAPSVFLHTNIYLHLLNGILVVWLLYLLAVARGYEARQAAWVGAMSGAIWMLLPILASSSLLVVQRMTVLSATFVLLGFIGYLYSRPLLDRHPRYALVSMSASVVICTTLATLTKENGALLPILILVAEATVLPRPLRSDVQGWHRIWRLTVLVAPAVALVGYLALRFQYDETVLLKREFSASDRLLTEARALWEYLYHAFLPATSNLGPFHDDYPIQRNWAEPLSLLAVAAWLGVVASAFIFRRRCPLFAFAVGWYLVGHALESTTIPLELYFEHRNYVPLIGPVFALVVATTMASRGRRLARVGAMSYAGMLAIVLFNTTSLWGRPALAAEIWAIHNPDSMRATQYLAQQLERRGDYATARRVLRAYVEDNPRNTGVELQVLALSCASQPHEPNDELLTSIQAGLQGAKFEHGVFRILDKLYDMAQEERCEAVNREIVYDLAAATVENPAFSADATTLHNLHVLMSEEAFAQRNLDMTMRHLEAALSARYTMPALSLAVQMLNSAGLYAEAEEFLRVARTREPSHPIRAMVWNRRLASLEESFHGSVKR